MIKKLWDTFLSLCPKTITASGWGDFQPCCSCWHYQVRLRDSSFLLGTGCSLCSCMLCTMLFAWTLFIQAIYSQAQNEIPRNQWGQETFNLKFAYFNYTSFWVLIFVYSSFVFCPETEIHGGTFGNLCPSETFLSHYCKVLSLKSPCIWGGQSVFVALSWYIMDQVLWAGS